MRIVTAVAFCVALGVQSADVLAQVVDLDPPGALEQLKQDKPAHYAKVMEMVDKIQGVPYTPNGQMDLRLELQKPDVTLRDVETSLPAKTRLTVPVEGTEYRITVLYTKHPATLAPVK